MTESTRLREAWAMSAWPERIRSRPRRAWS